MQYYDNVGFQEHGDRFRQVVVAANFRFTNATAAVEDMSQVKQKKSTYDENSGQVIIDTGPNATRPYHGKVSMPRAQKMGRSACLAMQLLCQVIPIESRKHKASHMACGHLRWHIECPVIFNRHIHA